MNFIKNSKLYNFSSKKKKLFFRFKVIYYSKGINLIKNVFLLVSLLYGYLSLFRISFGEKKINKKCILAIIATS